jgi:hypothetical protein
MGKFRELKVWQRGKDLAVYVYKITGQGAIGERLRAERSNPPRHYLHPEQHRRG